RGPSCTGDHPESIRSSCLSPIEGPFHNSGRHQFAPTTYLQGGSRSAQLDGHVAHADVLPQGGRRASRGDLPHPVSRGVVNRVPVTGDSAAGHLEADEPSPDAHRTLPGEGAPSDEVSPAELDHPPEVGFERGRV